MYFSELSQPEEERDAFAGKKGQEEDRTKNAELLESKPE